MVQIVVARADTAASNRSGRTPFIPSAPLSSPSHTLAQYARKTVSRGAMGVALAPLVRWEKLRDPAPGYTLLIGCNRNLGGMLMANLLMLGRQRRENLREVILVVDGSPGEVGMDIAARAAAAAPGLPVRVIHYNASQRRLSRMIDWGWVYAWMSWAIGIGACTTRYAMLHDFDALLLDENAVEARYAEIRRQRVEYLGIAYHTGGGVTADDRLVRTFELMFDAAFMRDRFEPVALFNTMKTIGGRRVEFDTFLNAQHRAGKTGLLPIGEDQMVHPSQMICQYVDYRVGRGRVPANNNLPMIPYYEFIGGDPALLETLTPRIRENPDAVPLWGRTLDTTTNSAEHRAWMRKQAMRMEGVLRPAGPDPRVLAYFDAIDAAGAPR